MARKRAIKCSNYTQFHFRMSNKDANRDKQELIASKQRWAQEGASRRCWTTMFNICRDWSVGIISFHRLRNKSLGGNMSEEIFLIFGRNHCHDDENPPVVSLIEQRRWRTLM